MAQTATRKNDPIQVDYELVVMDELPPRTSPAGGGGGRSILNEQLEKIEENVLSRATEDETSWYGKPVRIGLYTKGTAATAAKNVLQQRNGRTPAVAGWKFETRRVPNDPNNPAAGTKMGLFAIFTPDLIVEGALAAHEAKERVRKEKLAQARQEREEARDAGEDVDEEDDEDEDDEFEDDEEEDEEEEESDPVVG